MPSFCRWRFLPILVVGAGMFASGYFLGWTAIDPVHSADLSYYVRLYGLIGVVTGFAGWYFARLVASGRASLPAMAIIHIPPYLFILFVSSSNNPPVALLSTLAFAFLFVLMMLAKNGSDPDPGSAEPRDR
jgi:predicted MFS family arabinose efflux permease